MDSEITRMDQAVVYDSPKLVDQTQRAILCLRNSLAARGDDSTYCRDVEYAIRQYGKGLDHYAEVFHRLGFTGMEYGVDIGSGFGQWCISFLTENGRVLGIEQRRAFVDTSNVIARELNVVPGRHELDQPAEEPSPSD